jgi:hypothetical protein
MASLGQEAGQRSGERPREGFGEGPTPRQGPRRGSTPRATTEHDQPRNAPMSIQPPSRSSCARRPQVVLGSRGGVGGRAVTTSCTLPLGVRGCCRCAELFRPAPRGPCVRSFACVECRSSMTPILLRPSLPVDSLAWITPVAPANPARAPGPGGRWQHQPPAAGRPADPEQARRGQAASHAPNQPGPGRTGEATGSFGPCRGGPWTVPPWSTLPHPRARGR